MSVFKRGSVYWFKFTFNGTLVRESTRQSKKRVAKELEAARRTAMARGEAGIRPKKNVAFRDHSTTFLEFVAVRSAEKLCTIRFYNQCVKRLLEYHELATARLIDIDEAMIERYIQHRCKTVAAATVDRELATLRRMLILAERKWKLITARPHVQLLHRDHIRDFVLSREAEVCYLAIAPEPLWTAAILMLDAGLRISECARIQWTELNFESRTIQILSGKSAAAKRQLRMTDRVWDALVRARRLNGDNPFVFPGLCGKPVSTGWLEKQHRGVRLALQLTAEFVIHSMRHTFGTRLGELGVDVFTIKEVMGHSNIVVSQRYVHPGAATKRKAFEALSQSNNSVPNSGDVATPDAADGHKTGHTGVSPDAKSFLM
ncbi:MAG TPA: tyrosine-type recombinase/integrase [Terriglobia bacterium]|nr:tyrosine-type recombinase/integrase [Terriglobia bacterium]